MTIFVLDGNENHAVAATRALARSGHQIIVGAEESWSKAGWSRYAAGSFRYPSPENDPSGFIRALINQLEKHAGGFVMPMTERTTLPVSTQRDRISAAGGDYVLADHASLLRAFDKGETTELARSLGIVVPRSEILKIPEDAERAVASFPLPAVLKPRSSQQLDRAGASHATGRPVYARTEEDFLIGYSELHSRADQIIAQEFVEGTGAGYFALMRHGELMVEFAHRRLRDVHPTGSGSALRESAIPSDAMRSSSLALLKALKWHGVAMVEFRIRDDSPPVFLEVNGRFWNSLALATYSGVDFPSMLVGMSQGEEPHQPVYKEGIRCRWFLGDLRHLAAVWTGPPAGYPGRFPPRLRTTLQCIMPRPGTYHDNFMIEDPAPELGDWLHFFFRKLPAAVNNRT